MKENIRLRAEEGLWKYYYDHSSGETTKYGNYEGLRKWYHINEKIIIKRRRGNYKDEINGGPFWEMNITMVN